VSHEVTPTPTAGPISEASHVAPVVTNAAARPSRFFPVRPSNLKESGLRDVDVEALLLKALFTSGAATGKALSATTRLAGELVRGVLDRLRAELLITLKGATETGDFVYMVTETGAQRAKQYALHTSYCGAAPVTLEQYEASVHAQSVATYPVQITKFKEALSDLQLPPDVLSRLAQAVNAGRGLFLYGPPGNGKTSVAERLTRSYDDPIWIPRAVMVSGEIIRLFDSSVHEEVDPTAANLAIDMDQLDRRWVLIHRPTIVVGGELQLIHLDLMPSQSTGVFEAPIQMKANGGTLVIDDFGRQRCTPSDILNRWIVTLEKRADFLTLPNGRQLRVPFEQNLVLATNMRPSDVIDEAYMRRIPFKIELRDPTEETFVDLFRRVCAQFKVEYDESVVHYLVERYYRGQQRPFRYCHARDLIFQVRNLCELHSIPWKLTKQNIDIATSNYFCETP
jgi:predicted ATPase with chaperone activity